jgi:hypothetical protein
MANPVNVFIQLLLHKEKSVQPITGCVNPKTAARQMIYGVRGIGSLGFRGGRPASLNCWHHQLHKLLQQDLHSADLIDPVTARHKTVRSYPANYYITVINFYFSNAGERSVRVNILVN